MTGVPGSEAGVGQPGRWLWTATLAPTTFMLNLGSLLQPAFLSPSFDLTALLWAESSKGESSQVNCPGSSQVSVSCQETSLKAEAMAQQVKAPVTKARDLSSILQPI